MFNTYMKWTGILAGLYIVVTHASGFGTAFTQGARGIAIADKTLQGR